MKIRYALLPLALLLSLPSLALAERGFQASDLVSMDRYSSPVLSPDGRKLVFARRVVDMDANKAASALWIEDLSARDAAPPVRLTPEGWNVNSPAFSSDGATVYFLSGKSGSSQLYAIPAAGGAPMQVTDFALGVDAYALSPDGTRIAFAAAAFPACGGDLACSRQRFDAKRAASGVVFERMFIRHWDTWADGSLNRIFVATLPAAAAAPVTTATLLGADLLADVPSKPFGDLSDLAWAPDGQSLVVSARLSNAEEPRSTNFDLYRLQADGSGQAVNLTAANPAWDAGPVFSADGQTLYYRAMRRPGFEADRFALVAMDLATGKTREIAPQWDRSADNIVLSKDGKTLYATAQDLGQHPLFAVDIAGGTATRALGDGSIGDFAIAGPTAVFTRNSMRSGAQVFVGGLDGAPERAITPSAGEMLPDVKWGEYEQFSFPGWNDETVHGYVVKPWNFEAGKTYPVAFLIHGGPQGSFGDGWSYRWNPQTYAGQGYAVVMIDFHGSTGYGQAFTDAISQHWGDRPLEDLRKGWAAAQQRYAFLDGANACALGASYGGYMVNWIAGNWPAPASGAWKCLVNHDGVFDQRMMGYATEELWFSEWENGGTPYDNPQGYERFNPVNHVKNWRVPMLVVHGQQDFRIPVEQGIAAFTALQRQGIESKFLYFPDENHWVLKPANSLLWHDTVNAWLGAHLRQP
ncbi:alpha/beta hydrolase family protein [Cognatiluteimonas weifangensis]|uniref:S9 family peptidase n=1 Tax=Cognatiluteimonas weifangensis TaxID=2303539 RepID=A0A372DSC7_9GAMM|nr:S9 family peptidase [Luteimonas weifangensis]RFP62384.1 S9 family peptidase [Luteimonas weifangensis]